ncbi:hypothetical protein TON_1726 [Thermococcus onnurineus NA1]|uniref:Uncharacterized protein n=1 Tax=Thermococcus onnurineus (strain NA1) TaxID=523850 RepID=B6YUY8_THEON|nr:hypothetical protein [Thermococcus onnurineus]ACJ17216.1 hypothetical protein TON_1726 [Thermococcus onnurineus NA1]
MFRYILKLFALMFILFLIVGNLTAPAELTEDDVQVDGVMGTFYHIGKFIVVPFENLKYRLDRSDAGLDETGGESYDYSAPQVPPGYVESYFEFQGEKYKYYKPLNPEKSPVVENFTFKGGYSVAEGWYGFDAKDLVKDLYSEPVLEVFKLSLDAMYGKFDEEDREIFIKYTKMQGECDNGWCEDFNPVGAFNKLVDIGELGLPYTPEVMRHYLESNIDMFMKLGSGFNNDPQLPSKVIKGEEGIDCDGIVLYRYAFLYHLNKLMGIEAEYYLVGLNGVINGKVNPVGHAELFVYYPETGKWEIYSASAVTEYFYRYTSKDINLEAYKRFSQTKEAIVGYSEGDKKLSTYFKIGLTFAVDWGRLKPPQVYLPAGKLQFNSFEEALYWYLHSNLEHGGFIYIFLAGKWGSSSLGLGHTPTDEEIYEEYKDFPIKVYLSKLPTPEDPYVYRVKEWYGRTVTVEGLKEDLIKKGQYREINFIIDKGEPPEILKNPQPVFTLENAPPWLKERIVKYMTRLEKENDNGSGGESIIDLLIRGFKRLLSG